MATCLYFNLQVLPQDTKKKNFIGEAGYRKLFEVLDSTLKEQLKKKKLHENSFPLPRTDYFLVPFTTKFEDNFVYGRLRKFDQVDRISEFYTEEELYKVSPKNTGTSKQFHFNYCFDPRLHIIAIENVNGKLPKNTDVLEKFLLFIFEEIVHEQFPDYYLTCHALKETSELRQVEKSNRFKKLILK